jgi:ribosomal protein S18 acetylase RimI-like enzyme
LTSDSVDQNNLEAHPEDQGWPKGWSSIRLLAVRPEFRQMGVGHKLLEECVRRSRAFGSSTIGLHTTKIMEIARKMYERRGFVRVPKFDFHPTLHTNKIISSS